MNDIQYPENGKKNVNLKSTDLCGNTRNGVREVNIIQRLLEGQYISIVEDGDKATISADVSADYYNKAQINELIGDLDTVKFKIVDALPAVGAENVIYLVPKTAPDVGYDQYIWDSDASLFYPIGDTDIDLSDYYTKLQSDAKFQELLSNGTGITAVTDTTDFSQVSLGDKTVRQVTGLSVWNYVKSKMTGAISSFVTDDMTGNRVLVSTPLGKITYSPDITTEELYYLNNARSNIQDQIDEKMDSIVMGAETDTWSDTTPITYLDVPNNTAHVTRGSTIWTYIKSKLNVDNLTSITDTTKIGSVDKSKTNVVQQFTASVLFQYMWKKIYPVGCIYTSTSSTSPATLFGGTWERINGRFLVGAGSNGASGNEALNLTAGTTGGVYRHQHSYGIKYGAYYGQPTTTSDSTVMQLKTWNSSNTQSWSTASQNGNVQGRYSSWSGEGSISNMEHSAKTNLVNNLPPYLVVYIWRRVS